MREMRDPYRILMQKTEGKKSLGRTGVDRSILLM
jgi:hypothetical protein